MPLHWKQIQAEYRDDAAEHRDRCASLGLECALDVFEQLFHDHHEDVEFATLVRFIDWSNVQWQERSLSGVALRQVAVPRPYQHAVDEVRARVIDEGLTDERDDVLRHWNEEHSWFRAPILCAGDVTGSLLRYEMLVGFTRLGNLLGLLDRQHVTEVQLHRAWLGHR
jgi:hypothetical protein